MKKLHVIVLTNGLEIMRLLNITKGTIVSIHLLIFIRHKDIILLEICFKMFQKIQQKKTFILKLIIRLKLVFIIIKLERKSSKISIIETYKWEEVNLI